MRQSHFVAHFKLFGDRTPQFLTFPAQTSVSTSKRKNNKNNYYINTVQLLNTFSTAYKIIWIIVNKI